MARLARRNFRRNTRKLADILCLLPVKRLEQLVDLADHYRNHEQEFDPAGFIAGVRFDILENSPAENLAEFSRILGVYESRSTKLRLLGLLNDALRLALPAKNSAPPEIPAIVPDLDDPTTRLVLNGM